MPKMQLTLESIVTTDKLELPGLLFAPAKKTGHAAIWLHGMGDSGVFYHPKEINLYAQILAEKNIAFLAFNNRGAHAAKRIRIQDETLPEEDRVFLGGTHFERIADCVHDINGAVTFLRQHGYHELYLIGHSTGANKICAYHARSQRTPFSKYVLSGPGDDSGLFYNELGEARFWRALTYAKRSIQQGQPFKIMPHYTGMHPFTAQAAADILDPDGDYNTFPYYEATVKRLGKKPLFKEYATIDIPTLTIIGEFDEYTYTGGGTHKVLALMKRYTNKKALPASRFVSIAGADHSFVGQEKAYFESVATWLTT